MILLEIKNRIIEETLLHRFTRSGLLCTVAGVVNSCYPLHCGSYASALALC